MTVAYILRFSILMKFLSGLMLTTALIFIPMFLADSGIVTGILGTSFVVSYILSIFLVVLLVGMLVGKNIEKDRELNVILGVSAVLGIFMSLVLFFIRTL